MRTVAVVLAGGSGLRLGGELPKQLQLLAGRTLLEHSVAAFEQAPGVDDMIVVMPAAYVDVAASILSDKYGKLRRIIAGGADRPGSTRCAIDLLSNDPPVAGSPHPPAGEPHRLPPHRPAGEPRLAHPAPPELDCNVLFHDAARPLVDQRIIADCVAGLGEHEALGVVVPTADTIVRLEDGTMVSIPPRESLGRCQTPQGFRLSVIRRAYELAAADLAAGTFSATDDCGMVLRYLPEVPVRAVAGSERNLKITYAGDLRIAESLLLSPDS
ncbi:MAG TPA: IspD/TarI family cytidylyltransferase [Streptosporangiaceae bacterium]|jgi:2-C-methyl-D-erythritol 4-phosphate cytidylyltransferase|nr:IspD/TarI family cytidylyltransferase [Streptosporangiaceae bacterium]